MTEETLSNKGVKNVDVGGPELNKVYWEEDVKNFIKKLKEEMNTILKINVENSHESGVSEELRKTIMEIIIGSFLELENKIDKLAGKELSK